MHKTRIIIAEDESAIGLDIQDSLIKLGYDVPCIVSTGEELIQKSGELKPDLLLIDIVMPGKIDGIEAVRKIREKHDIPVIYLTGHNSDKIFNRAIETNPYGYLIKPAGMNDLLTSIKTALHRHKMEKNLWESGEKFRNLVENLNEVIYEIDKNATILYVSPNIEALSGYTPKELLGESYTKFIHPDEDMEHRAKEFQKVLSDKTLINEYKFLAKDGGTIWIRNSTLPVLKDGEVTGVHGILMDITEKKTADEDLCEALSEAVEAGQALQESEEKYRLLADNVTDVIWTTDILGRYTYVSPSVEKLSGYSVKEALSRSIMNSHPSDSLERLYKGFAKELVSEEDKEADPERSWITELELYRKDGSTVWIEITQKFLRDEEGNPAGFIGVARDIGEHKKARDTLWKEKELSDKLIQTNQAIIVGLNENHYIKIFSDGAERITGYKKEEVIGKDWFKIFFKEGQLEEMNKVWDDSWGNDAYLYINPILTKKNEERIVSWTNSAIKDENGNPIMLICSGQDITEQKQTEDQIKSSLKEKEILLKEVHHRVKNNMQIISSLFSLQEGNIEEPELLKIFKVSHDRIRAMSLIHERLYKSKDFTNINFAEYVNTMSAELFHTYMTNPDKITLQVDVENVCLGIDRAIPCGLVINELLSNSLKHAFPPKLKKKGKIRISMKQKDDDAVELIIEDNGTGIPENIDFNKINSLGLVLVYRLTEDQLKGKVELKRQNGTKWIVQF